MPTWKMVTDAKDNLCSHAYPHYVGDSCWRKCKWADRELSCQEVTLEESVMARIMGKPNSAIPIDLIEFHETMEEAIRSNKDAKTNQADAMRTP